MFKQKWFRIVALVIIQVFASSNFALAHPNLEFISKGEDELRVAAFKNKADELAKRLNANRNIRFLTVPERLTFVINWLIDNPYVDLSSLSNGAIVDWGIGGPFPYPVVEMAKKMLEINPNLKVYGMDKFIPYAKITNMDGDIGYIDENGKLFAIDEVREGRFYYANELKRERIWVGSFEALFLKAGGENFNAGNETVEFHPFEKFAEDEGCSNLSFIQIAEGFQIPEEKIPKEKIKVICCFDLLSMYFEDQEIFEAALKQIGQYLAEGGILLEGNAAFQSNAPVAFNVYQKEKGQLVPRELIVSKQIIHAGNIGIKRPSELPYFLELVEGKDKLEEDIKIVFKQVESTGSSPKQVLSEMVKKLNEKGYFASITKNGLLSLKYTDYRFKAPFDKSFWAKDFRYINVKLNKEKLTEPMAFVIDPAIVGDNPSVLLAVLNLKEQWGDKVKIVLQHSKKSEELGAEALYEAIKEATNGAVDLKGKVDLEVSAKDSPKKIVELVRTEFKEVKSIRVIGREEWAKGFKNIQRPELEKITLVICKIGEGNEVTQGDLAVLLGLKDTGVLAKKEMIELNRRWGKGGAFFVVETKEIGEAAEIEKYRQELKKFE